MKPQHLFAAQACTLTVVLTLGGLAHAQAVAPVPTAGVTASSAAAAPTPVAAPVTAPAAAVVGSSAPGTTAPEAPVATGTVSPEPAAGPAVAQSTAPLAPSAVAPVALTAPPATPPAAAPGHATPGRRSLIWQPHKAAPRVQEKPRYPLLPLFTLHAVANTVWNKDVGYDLFSDNDVGARFGVQLDADVVTLTPGLVVAAELGYTYEASSDGRVPTGLGVGASIEAHHPHVAALVNWSLLDWLAVHARAQAGLSFTHVEIEHFEVAAGSGALSSRTRANCGTSYQTKIRKR